MTTPVNLVGEATIRITADTDPALRAIALFARNAQGEFRGLRTDLSSELRRIEEELARIGRTPVRVTADTADADQKIRTFAQNATTALRGVGSAATSFAAIGGAIGTVVPVAAGLVATLEAIAPAGAVAATGMLAIRQASAVIQLSMIGVEDAITAAFAGGEESAAEFQEALEKLAPSAQAFALEIKNSRDELVSFQQSIQQELFEGFASSLSRLGESVLPILQESFRATATTLNDMALGASNAALELAQDGTLGRALEGANQGLSNLRDTPEQIVTALGRIVEAGAPGFDRLTEAAANAASRISGRLEGAFETGALQTAVNTAVDLLFQLGGVVQDIFSTLGNVFGAVSASGLGFVGILSTIFDTLSRVTGTETFQQFISNLAEAVGSLVSTLLPVLLQIFEALGPVLVAASSALGALVQVLSPVLELIGSLVSAIAPVLTPVLQTLEDIFRALTPIISSLATVLQSALTPILSSLPGFLRPILRAFTGLIEVITPLIEQFLTGLAPQLEELSTAFGELLLAVAPAAAELLILATEILSLLVPLIRPIISIVLNLSSVMTRALSGVIRNVVIPAFRALTQFLRGDFSGSFRTVRGIVSNVVEAIGDLFPRLVARVVNVLSGLGSRFFNIMSGATRRLASAASAGINNTVGIIRGLVSRASGALGNLRNVLFSRGRELVQGFIDGIRSLVGGVVDTARGLVDAVTDFLPGSPARRGPLSGSGYVLLRGRRFTEDFARGIENSERAVREASLSVASSVALTSQAPDARNLPVSLTRPTAPFTRSPTQINITLSNQGVISSRSEVLDWLTRALEDLRRTNRLPSGGAF